MSKLCIDPGHGFANRRPDVYDSGASSAGVSEADVVLQWALTIKWVFAQAGVSIFLTRDDDRDPDPVSRRDDKAEAAGCTHFISLHCNAGGGTGTETFYRDDKRWAEAVHAVAVAATGLSNRGIKLEGASQHSRLAVMDFDGKACLVELGFIDDPDDRRVLQSRESRLAFARRLLDLWQRVA